MDLSGDNYPQYRYTPGEDINAGIGPTGTSKRPRRSQSPRALSSQGFRHVRDETTGQLVQVRRMSENASLDFNSEAAARYQENPRDFEFKVLSNEDINRFVRECDAQSAAQWNQMELKIQNEAQCSRTEME